MQYTHKEAGDGGTSVPYPLVTVCTSGAAYTPLPCTPKASIYSDPDLQAPHLMANPFRGDAFGNIEFYAAAGTYIVSVTAPYSPGYSFKMSASGGFAGTIQNAQVAVGTAANTIGSDGNLIWDASEEDPPRKKLTVQGGLGVLRPYNYTNALNSTWSIDFGGHQANAATASFGAIQQKVIANTNGAVTGQFDFFVEKAGVATDILTLTGTGATSPNINGILQVGIGPGQYASLQAAHDALPAPGGTVFVMATGTPFGAAGTTLLTITKPIHILFDAGSFTYSGAGAQAILCSASTRAVLIEGSGRRGDDVGTSGTTINISNTAANGITTSACNGFTVRDLNLIGPASGTGKGIINTGGRSSYSNLNISSFGSDGWTNDGTATNANSVLVSTVRSSSNGGNGFVTKGSNGQLVTFVEADGSLNTGDGWNVANQLNVFIGTNADGNTGYDYHFVSGGTGNSGTIFSNNAGAGPPGGIQFDAGANSNTFTQLGSGGTLLVTSGLGTNNSVWSQAQTTYTSGNNNMTLGLSSGTGAGIRGSSINFQDNNTNKWTVQKTASNLFSISDPGVLDMILLNPGSAVQLASGGSQDVRVNDQALAATGTGGFSVWSGGASSTKKAFILGTGYANFGPVTVGALPAAAAGNKGNMITVSDSTAIGAEGQVCVGGGAVTALAFSTGLAWKCF